MGSPLRLLAALNAALLLAAVGCGDEGGGGCGPAPSKQEQKSEQGGSSGNTGSTSRGGDIQIQDKKGRVPKAYQRGLSAYEGSKSTATISKPIIAKEPAPKPRPAPVRVIRRNVDGIADRVELACRIMAASSDGLCSGAANYAEIKERCCPGGAVERCTKSTDGVVIVGRGCETAGR